MKKTISLILILSLLFIFCGCSSVKKVNFKTNKDYPAIDNLKWGCSLEDTTKVISYTKYNDKISFNKIGEVKSYTINDFEIGSYKVKLSLSFINSDLDWFKENNAQNIGLTGITITSSDKNFYDYFLNEIEKNNFSKKDTENSTVYYSKQNAIDYIKNDNSMTASLNYSRVISAVRDLYFSKVLKNDTFDITNEISYTDSKKYYEEKTSDEKAKQLLSSSPLSTVTVIKDKDTDGKDAYVFIYDGLYSAIINHSNKK